MNGQRFDNTVERRVKALQVGLAVGLLVLVVLAERSTAPSVQWPVLVLVLFGALLTERCQRGSRQRAGRHTVGATPQGAPTHDPVQRLWVWVQRQISDGVVHGHEEGERCNALCRRTRAADTPAPGPERAASHALEPAPATRQGRPAPCGVARARSPRSPATRIRS